MGILDVPVRDASTTVKGKIKLTGDLAGTADLPTVPGLSGKVDKNSIVFNVKDSTYGAVGDGVANDSAAIQSAINAAAVGGGVVFIPSGTYRLNSSLIPKSNVSIRGAGTGKTILKPYGTVSAIQDITTGSAVNPLHDIVFEDFEIDGINQTLTGGVYSVQTKGIFILYMKRVFFRNLYIHDTAATGIGADFFQDSLIDGNIVERCGRLNDGTQPGGSGIGIGLGDLSSSFENLVITNNHAIDNKFFGIFIETQDPGKRPFGNIIANNVVRGNKIGIGLCGGTGTVVNGNIAYQNTQDGISVNPGSFTTPTPDRYTIISNNTVYGNANIGIRLSATSGKILEGYQISGNKVWLNLTGIQSTNTDNASKYISINDNHVFQNSQAGISLASASTGTYEHVQINNNLIWNNGTALATPRSGIRVTRPVTDLQVINNRAFDDKVSKTQAEGLYIASGITITGGKFAGNDFRDNASAAVTMLGTLTDVERFNNSGWTDGSGVVYDADINASAAIAGTKIANTPAGNLSATTVQAAINELDTEKENTANKSSTTTLGTSNTLFPSQNAVKTYVDTSVAAIPLTNYVLKAGDSLTGTLSTTGALMASGNFSAIPASPGVYMGLPTGLTYRITFASSVGSVRAIDNSGGALRIINSTDSTVQLVSGSTGLFTFGNTTPTHTITLPSTSTGIAIYNTTDQTTNYERGTLAYASNQLELRTAGGGTGLGRDIFMQVSSATNLRIRFAQSTTQGSFTLNRDLSTADAIHTHLNGTHTQSSGSVTHLNVQPSITQTSTAGYTALSVNAIENTTGSGTKLLADFKVGGSSRFSVSNTGKLFIASSTAPASPANGDIWFDGTDLKMRVGGVTKTFTLV